MENNPEIHFSSDAELERAMDEIVNGIKDEMLKEASKISILNVKRMKQIELAYAALKHITSGEGVKISYEEYEPFKAMGGSIVVEGKSLEFNNPELFAKIAGLADNMEVYPLTKNAVCMAFTFHGLTKPIE